MQRSLRLWFALLAAPAAWSIAGVTGWAVGSRVCTGLPIGAVRMILGSVSIGALAIAAAALVVAIGNWRVVSVHAHHADERSLFMALGGIFVSGAFAIGTIWFGLNAVFVTACGGMR